MIKSAAQRLAARYLAAAHSKLGCIIATGEWDGKRVLLKNRDRNYEPEVKIIHEVRNGVEVAYMADEITGWMEGMNEHGIGVVNSALMVERDENEKKSPKKSQDGERILKALEQDNIEDALEIVKTFKGGVKGHTFVSDGTTTYSVESTRKHKPIVNKLSDKKVHVRTNHGIEHAQAGYQEGEDLESSHQRMGQAKKVLTKTEIPDDLAPALFRGRKKDRKDPNSMVRDTDRMRTTSQIVMDLTDKRVLFYLIPDRVSFLDIERDLGKRKPKIKIQVFEYVDADKAADIEVKQKG